MTKSEISDCPKKDPDCTLDTETKILSTLREIQSMIAVISSAVDSAELSPVALRKSPVVPQKPSAGLVADSSGDPDLGFAVTESNEIRAWPSPILSQSSREVIDSILRIQIPAYGKLPKADPRSSGSTTTSDKLRRFCP